MLMGNAPYLTPILNGPVELMFDGTNGMVVCGRPLCRIISARGVGRRVGGGLCVGFDWGGVMTGCIVTV